MTLNTCLEAQHAEKWTANDTLVIVMADNGPFIQHGRGGWSKCFTGVAKVISSKVASAFPALPPDPV